MLGIAPASVQAIHAQPSTQYDELLCSYFTGNECTQAKRIMWCESSGRANAYSQNNYGLMQINGIHAREFTSTGDPTEFYDPEFNIQVAYVLYQRRGWQPWSGCL